MLFKYIGEHTDTFATGKSVSAKVYKTKGFRIEGIELPEITVLAFDFAKDFGIEDLKIILGPNFITPWKWYFDLNKKTWAFSPSLAKKM